MPKFEGVCQADNGSWYFKATLGRDPLGGKRIQVNKRGYRLMAAGEGCGEVSPERSARIHRAGSSGVRERSPARRSAGSRRPSPCRPAARAAPTTGPQGIRRRCAGEIGLEVDVYNQIKEVLARRSDDDALNGAVERLRQFGRSLVEGDHTPEGTDEG